MLKVTSPFDSYTVKKNTVNLTTKPVNDENRAYLVDRKLIDIILKQVVGIPFDIAKEAILAHMNEAEDFNQLVQKFDESIYIHQVCEIFEASEPEELATVRE